MYSIKRWIDVIGVWCYFSQPRYSEAFQFYKAVFLSCSRIKATLTSHMDFRKYPMDVQTLRLQIGACKYKVITDIFD